MPDFSAHRYPDLMANFPVHIFSPVLGRRSPDPDPLETCFLDARVIKQTFFKMTNTISRIKIFYLFNCTVFDRNFTIWLTFLKQHVIKAYIQFNKIIYENFSILLNIVLLGIASLFGLYETF
jgi:hypothetical protein